MRIKKSRIFLCGLLGACVWMSGCGRQEPAAADEEQVSGQVREPDETQTIENTEQMPEQTDVDVAFPQTLSIMGDSISTYMEWIPENYNVFYPLDGVLEDVNQTWWKMVLDDMDMTLCANASSAGSTCVGNSLGMDNPQHGCSDFRVADLAGKDGVYPDIIIVYMGTNDFLMGVPIGSNDGTQYVEEGEIENFSDAYSLMLDKLAAYYPGADVFCCTLPPIGTWGTGQPYEIMVNGNGMTSEEYSRQIAVIADAKGCCVIDLQNCGITIDNMTQYVSDGVHLTPDGMVLMRDAVETAITGFYQ